MGGANQPALHRAADETKRVGGGDTSQKHSAVSLEAPPTTGIICGYFIFIFATADLATSALLQMQSDFYFLLFFPSPTCAINAPRPPAAPSSADFTVQQLVGRVFGIALAASRRCGCFFAPGLVQDWVEQTDCAAGLCFFIPIVFYFSAV